MFRPLAIGICLLLTGMSLSSVWGQNESSVLRLSFNRQNNFTYGTQVGLTYFYQKGKYRLEGHLGHDNLFNTRRKTAPFVQLFVRGSIWQYYQLNPKWEVASWLETDQFWNTGNQRHTLYGGVRYRPMEGTEITPILGYSWDLRSGIWDQGASPGIQVQSRYDFGEGLQMETRMLARVKYINPRHQRNVILQSEWSKTFSEDAAMSLLVQGGSNQMDDYQANSIERIKSDTVAARLSLQYRLMPGVFWESTNQASWTRRMLDYDVFKGNDVEFNDLSFDQTDFYTQQKVSFRGKKTHGWFRYAYQNLGRGYDLDNSRELPEREFERLLDREKQKDYFRRQTELELSLYHQAKPKHQLALVGTNRYQQYDTPGEANLDDHDELNYGLSGEWTANWTRSFVTRYQLLGNVRRYAFLFSERSQDNYTQRSLRLEFDYRWDINRKWRLAGEQFLYVTYHVKDFEDRNLTDRSTRNLESRVRLNYRPKKGLDLEWNLYRRELHVSYLNWEEFAETPLDTTVTYIADFWTHWQVPVKWEKTRIQVDVGYKHFSQLRYLNTSMISLQNVLSPINLHIRSHQTGPQTGIRLVNRRPASLELSIWWQLQVQDFRYEEVASFSTLSANYREEILQNTEIAFRPFVRLQANILLRQ
ncbi:MAG: hypothetical protein AAF399_05770 [Bacteroidota bacterium]